MAIDRQTHYIAAVNNLICLYYDDETFADLFLPFLSGGPLFNELLVINILGCEKVDLSSWLSK